MAAGLEAEIGAGRLWVAGADRGEVRAYDSETGTLLASYPFEAGFLDDHVTGPEAIDVTDSLMPRILVVPLGEDGGRQAPDDTVVPPISGDLRCGDGFNVNGIVATPPGLVVVHTRLGELFHIDPTTGESTRLGLGEATLTAGDGMQLGGQTLFVVRCQLGPVAVLELDDATTATTQVAEPGAVDLDVPTMAAPVGEDRWAVNARFGTEATPDSEYWITRLPASSDGG